MIPCGTKWWPLQNPSVPTKTHPKNTVWGGVWTPKHINTKNIPNLRGMNEGIVLGTTRFSPWKIKTSNSPNHWVDRDSYGPRGGLFHTVFFFAFRVLQSLTVGTTPWKLNSFSHDFFLGRSGKNFEGCSLRCSPSPVSWMGENTTAR